ncbi:cobalt ECF transporter T component CbiQ [Schinkia azotoformans]|uniref:Cobalt ABC transporter inner membrane protein CbiQ n=1 Tax=Schinkia azotoformans LMG 9581 TaxID=1131731 RepID=K6D866_SCHAZ|nr:cobalt ECF transporter T component CbiQ [Schinkia azotoformans]EKN64283.1 cobalt ABC transporter inner membrane protein CbiQ [Schinkia azotoformans LMG 9581]MEC1638008.1 cobalt ECF transporter T component CbiQ [Schinkia azotoformans]MEC1721562.1 cobalt ECF transporter T component CbiQ [Schinkia azotoformans]MEC1944905.1 cobalt ECF transporter T component CbiQ [Schinkia azotoformans]MED4413639.1 cobalt ECF transporter T component CbiQ [Schinkia azotoformans]
MNIQIDTLSYNSRFRKVPPIYKIIFTILLCVMVFLSHIPVQITIFLGVFVFLCCYEKIPVGVLLKWIAVPSLFLFASMPAIILQASNLNEMNSDIWLSIIKIDNWQIYISESGLGLAKAIIFRSLSLLICVFALVMTTPFNEILHALHKMRTPQVLLDILVGMYRFIFIFLRYAGELYMVFQSRGGNVTWERTFHSVGLVIVQLFVKTFEKYKRMLLVMESRGFHDQLYYADEQRKSAPKKFTGGALFILFILIGLEWWCRGS